MDEINEYMQIRVGTSKYYLESAEQFRIMFSWYLHDEMMQKQFTIINSATLKPGRKGWTRSSPPFGAGFATVRLLALD